MRMFGARLDVLKSDAALAHIKDGHQRLRPRLQKRADVGRCRGADVRPIAR